MKLRKFIRGKNYYFQMLDEAGEIILESQAYQQKDARNNGIVAARKNMGSPDLYERISKWGTLYFILKSSNGQEIGRSRGFKDESSLQSALAYAQKQGSSSQSPAAAAVTGPPQPDGGEAYSTDGRSDDYKPLKFYEAHSSGAENGFDFFAAGGESYFTFNLKGKIILISEGYKSDAARDKGVRTVERNLSLDTRYQRQLHPNGKYFFNLRAGNNQEIATSRWFDSKSELEKVRLQLVKSGTAGSKEDAPALTQESVDQSKNVTYDLFESGNGRYYFSIKNSDGKTILSNNEVRGFGTKEEGSAKVEEVRHFAPIATNYERKTGRNGKFYFFLNNEEGGHIAKSTFFDQEEEMETAIGLLSGPADPSDLSESESLTAIAAKKAEEETAAAKKAEEEAAAAKKAKEEAAVRKKAEEEAAAAKKAEEEAAAAKKAEEEAAAAKKAEEEAAAAKKAEEEAAAAKKAEEEAAARKKAEEEAAAAKKAEEEAAAAKKAEEEAAAAKKAEEEAAAAKKAEEEAAAAKKVEEEAAAAKKAEEEAAAAKHAKEEAAAAKKVEEEAAAAKKAEEEAAAAKKAEEEAAAAKKAEEEAAAAKKAEEEAAAAKKAEEEEAAAKKAEEEAAAAKKAEEAAAVAKKAEEETAAAKKAEEEAAAAKKAEEEEAAAKKAEEEATTAKKEEEETAAAKKAEEEAAAAKKAEEEEAAAAKHAKEEAAAAKKAEEEAAAAKEAEEEEAAAVKKAEEEAADAAKRAEAEAAAMKKAEEAGVAAVMKAEAVPTMASIDREDDYLRCSEYENREVNERDSKAALFKHEDGQFYFALYHENGDVKVRSEGFKSADERDKELSGVLKHHNDESMYKRIKKGTYYLDILYDKSGREIGRSCLQKDKKESRIKAGLATVQKEVNIPETEGAAAPNIEIPATSQGQGKKYPGGFQWWWILIIILVILIILWFFSVGI